MAWIEPLGDPASRVELPHLRPPAQTWTVATDAGTWVQPNQYALGAVGEQITEDWQLTTVWSVPERPQADALVALLHDRLTSVDARLTVNLGTPLGGTALEFVVEAHEVIQRYNAGSSEVTLTVRRVDGGTYTPSIDVYNALTLEQSNIEAADAADDFAAGADTTIARIT